MGVNSDDQLRLLDCVSRLGAVVRVLARKSPQQKDAERIAEELAGMSRRLQPGPIQELTKLISDPNVVRITKG